MGPLGGSGNGGEQASGVASSVVRTTTTSTPSAPVSLELATKKLVWVCLIEDSQGPVIDGLNLLAGQSLGPYEGAAFEIAFGNGALDVTVNGRPHLMPFQI